MIRRLFPAILTALLSLGVFASEPTIWSVNSRAEVLKGDSRGVSIAHNGAITLAPRWSEVFRSEQAYIWAAAVDPSGNIFLGTGGDGKVFKVDPTGKGALFADLAEINVSSLAIGRNGEIFAGTSPDGKVYRIAPDGTTNVHFTPKDKYIWSIAVLSDGSLAVGTGDGGRIYKVAAAGADPERSILFDTSETHIISLTTDKQGNLYAGTDSNGLVMRFGADGKPFGLLDSPLREIHEMTIGPDGSLYVLALGESASIPKPIEAAAPSAAAAESKTVSVDKPAVSTAEQVKSRYDLSGARSAVYRIRADGNSEILWASATAIGFSIYAHDTGDGVFVGTSEKGRVYSIDNQGNETLVLQSDASQISSIRMAGRSLIAASSNPGTLYRLGPESLDEGIYESSVLDAKTTAKWGRLWWHGSGNVSLQSRSGNTEKPDETWSVWSPGISSQRGSQVTSPNARFLQWRAVLKSSSVPAKLENVNVAFVPRNIAPEILTITVLPTNVGLAANPPVQIDPNIELAGLDPALFGIPVVTVAPRRVYQRGATSLQWTSEDRNGDKLVYDVHYREMGESNFKLLREGQTDNFITIDGQSLADGQYVFRIVARDNPSNPPSAALSGEKATEPINIDNSAPVVSIISSSAGQVVFEATDRSSYVARAEYSINAGDWIPIFPEDGISDSPVERYVVNVSQGTGEYAVTLRVFDINGNSANARQTVRK